jgi:hypothetical protein
MPMVIDWPVLGRIPEAGPEQHPAALARATPKQDRNSREHASSIDTHGHRSATPESPTQLRRAPIRGIAVIPNGFTYLPRPV